MSYGLYSYMMDPSYSYMSMGMGMGGCCEGYNTLLYGVGYAGTALTTSLFSDIVDVCRSEIRESRRARYEDNGGGGGAVRNAAKSYETLNTEYNNKATLIANQLQSVNASFDAYSVTAEQVDTITIAESFNTAVTEAEKDYKGDGTGAKEIAYTEAENAYNNATTGYVALKNKVAEIAKKPADQRTAVDNKNYTDWNIEADKLQEAKKKAGKEKENAKKIYDDAVKAKRDEDTRLNGADGVKANLKKLISERDSLKTKRDEAKVTQGAVTESTQLSNIRDLLDKADGTIGERVSSIKFSDGTLTAPEGDVKKSDLRKMINLYRNGNKAEKLEVQKWFKANYADNVRDKHKNSDIDTAAKIIINTKL